jgi:acyl-CoA synthetase (AMP-forming)/AMP-acid ligase II
MDERLNQALRTLRAIRQQYETGSDAGSGCIRSYTVQVGLGYADMLWVAAAIEALEMATATSRNEANYIGGSIPILLKQGARPDDADNPVRLMVGAAAPADEWEAFQQRFNTKLLEVYGMTECYCCLVSPYDAPRAGSCGKAITGWDVRIVDENDNECPADEVGEFIARSNKMWVGTTGYYKKPESTLEFLQNGWIHTGDMGRRDTDGYFYFADRKKQAIRRRGENISSFEVESVIDSHPAVLEACVVGVPFRSGRGRGQGGRGPQGQPHRDARGTDPLVRAADRVFRHSALHRDPDQPAKDA